MKVGKIIHKTALGAAYVGLICYGGMMACEAYDFVKEKIRKHKSKKWKEGYDEGIKQRQVEIDYLKERNQQLMDEAFKRSEAAE